MRLWVVRLCGCACACACVCACACACVRVLTRKVGKLTPACAIALSFPRAWNSYAKLRGVTREERELAGGVGLDMVVNNKGKGVIHCRFRGKGGDNGDAFSRQVCAACHDAARVIPWVPRDGQNSAPNQQSTSEPAKWLPHESVMAHLHAWIFWHFCLTCSFPAHLGG